MPSSRVIIRLSLLGSLLGLGACSSTPEKPAKDPALEAEMKRQKLEKDAIAARQKNIHVVVIKLDEALSQYVDAVAHSENQKAARRAASLRNYIERQSRKYFVELSAYLQDEAPRNRAIAAAALGFSGADEAIAPIENLLEDTEAFVRTNACLGLATLAKPLTPLGRLNALAVDEGQPIETRRAAAWALLSLERAGSPVTNFEKLWPKLLAGDILAQDAVLTIHALRGLGLIRSPNLLAPAARYFSHPRPLVRQAALIAAGRSLNRDAVPLVLPFLGADEKNLNVRLTARKVLKALAGNRVDHEYDIRAWKREFGI